MPASFLASLVTSPNPWSVTPFARGGKRRASPSGSATRNVSCKKHWGYLFWIIDLLPADEGSIKWPRALWGLQCRLRFTAVNRKVRGRHIEEVRCRGRGVALEYSGVSLGGRWCCGSSSSANTGLPASFAALTSPNPCLVTAFAEGQRRKCRAQDCGFGNPRRYVKMGAI